MSNAMEIRSLTWEPGRRFAIKNLNITVPKRAIYGFLGPNGSGKTSTIRLFMGMARPGSGSMQVLGKRVPADMPEILARVGFVPETSHLYPWLSVEEAVRVHGAFYPHWDASWAEKMRQAFRLDPRARVGKLSKGERGKLLILLALAQRPELLVLDEPTDGLDPVVRRDVLAAVLEYVSRSGATVFISSHLVHELERFCDWVGILDDGKMLAEMPMEAFKNEIKKLRILDPPDTLEAGLPFQVLGRQAGDALAAGETWIVRGWDETMAPVLTETGARIREVVHLDLEEGFVELLRSARPDFWTKETAMGLPGEEG